ncbi:MAG: biopolymer transporter ExbD [Acidocella sp. 20-57-95]|nr:MAG: biopolymer transporter ExbD [Acidocella sp. 20-57-95]HQT63128.1 biopolymer transporter ExbD [Acidocella sp.]
MAMQLGGSTDEDEVVSTINTTPLVDVMLVLLIIFLITIPVVTHTVPVVLPKERNQPLQTTPQNINISVNKNGDIFWNQTYVKDLPTLVDDLTKVAVVSPQPTIEIRGDANVQYKFIGEVMYACQHVGILKVGFITEPPPHGAGN